MLSVGAEQGLAHIGVLNALRERGVRVDCVIGTSMGALIGGLYASAPERDLAGRYRDVFELYAGVSTSGVGPKTSDLWFAATTLWGTPKAWERMQDVLRTYLGSARIESLPVPFVTVHQRLTDTGARSETVRGGRLADEIAASIANPLIFPGMSIQRGTLLDPGLDRVSSVALETACEAFPDHQFVVSNVTPSAVFVSERMLCQYQELRFGGVGVDRLHALTARDPDFTRLVRAGYDKAQRELDFGRLPSTRPVVPALEFVHVMLEVELSERAPDGAAWDGLDGLPDIRQTTTISSCPGCETRATHAGQKLSSEGSDARKLVSDLGVLALRRGFVLQTRVVEVDVSDDDDAGEVTATFEAIGSEVTKKLPHASVRFRFTRP
ncbi:MAG TPA: patatin-like phospholipase family protein [Polyangiaceae bacterium]|nr:patatin-like phospholipase family protein [Polyangiaceae bacterium]